MKAIHRLFQYIEAQGIKPTRLEKEIGLSNGYLGTQKKRDADLGEGVLLKIIDNCLDLNLLWLLTGEGEMLVTPGDPGSPASIKSEQDYIDIIKAQSGQLDKSQEQISKSQEQISKSQEQIDRLLSIIERFRTDI